MASVGTVRVCPGGVVVLFEGKVVLVAGVGPGLGRAIAVRAAAEGAAVALVSRRREYADDLRDELIGVDGRAITVQGDLTRPADCARIAADVAGRLGGIDSVVYNAFYAGAEAPVEEADLADWRPAMEVNAFGALEIVKACLGSLKNRQGSVVLINSRQIRRLGQPRGGYAMSKAALFMAGRVLAHELGPYGIRVNTVVSGWMWGPAVADYFAQASKANGKTVEEQYDEVARTFPLRRLPLPEEVADAVVFLASAKASAITGQSIDVNAGESFH
jgi:NAD(P)-dependent dehydrogenase (short-subunit alcohol dehydrogenase family)